MLPRPLHRFPLLLSILTEVERVDHSALKARSLGEYRKLVTWETLNRVALKDQILVTAFVAVKFWFDKIPGGQKSINSPSYLVVVKSQKHLRSSGSIGVICGIDQKRVFHLDFPDSGPRSCTRIK